MLNRVINGFTIIAAEMQTRVVRDPSLVILGMRYVAPGEWEYVTAVVKHLDDTMWDWGHYSGSHFASNSVEAAVNDFTHRVRWA